MLLVIILSREPGESFVTLVALDYFPAPAFNLVCFGPLVQTEAHAHSQGRVLGDVHCDILNLTVNYLSIDYVYLRVVLLLLGNMKFMVPLLFIS